MSKQFKKLRKKMINNFNNIEIKENRNLKKFMVIDVILTIFQT